MAASTPRSLARTASGSGSYGRMSSEAPAGSHAAAAAAAAASTSAAALADARPALLHASALSPAEYACFPQWFAGLQQARSGAADCAEESDALRFLRDECNLSVQDEVLMLSLFERFPYGLPSGVFYALLRLTSHAQRGDAISLDALFTQAPPPKTGLSAAAATGPLPPPPQHVATMAAKSAAAAQAASVPPVSRSGPPEVPAKPGKAAAASAAPPPATPPVISSAKLQPPLIPTPTGGAAQAAANDEHLRPANPFRPTPVIGVPAASGSASTAGASPVAGSGILGFDPAPNPFKNAAKTSTKLVRPTPVVANASTSVLGSPSPPPNARAGANPFRGGVIAVPGRRGSARDDERVDSPGTSVTEGTAVGVGALHSPPLPPRPTGAERPPPPLPPRTANPLIQAGLAASREVRRKQEALPPKTYTVLQSSGAPVKKSAPRLLDGKAPPPGAPIPAPVAPPPTHHSKRKPTSSSGHDPKRSVSDLPSPSMLRGLSGDDSVDDGRDGAQNGPALRHPRAVSGGGVARVTPTYKPKASYGSIGRESKSGGLPSWLREQEELQRSALADGGASLPRSSSAHHSYSHQRQHSGHAPPDAPPSVTSSRIEFLDNDMDDDDGGLSSEQASRAASIDRNNPFFLRSARDADAQPPTSPGEPLTKLAVARAAAAAAVLDGRDLPRPDNAWVRGNSDGTMSGRGDADGFLRPLGRSKTLQSRAAGAPPAPPRKKADEKPAQLDSGTYAGFGKPARQEGPQGGGLRLVPPSKKAEVGIPPHIILERERERASRERGAMHQNPVPPPPPVRRASNVSTLSRTSSSGGTPMSPVDGDQPFVLVGGVKAPGLRERVSGLFGLQDSAAKGTRPIDTLKQDFQSVAERHEWLARAAERARGRPISEGTVGLMSDQDLGQDAPHVDDGYEEERRREQQAQLEGADRSTPLARRASGSYSAARPTAHLRRASSNARRSVAAMEGPFSDLSRETGPNGTPREELSSALVVDDEAPGPDVDRRSSEYAQLA